MGRADPFSLASRIGVPVKERANPSEEERAPSFGRILGGSSIGMVVGGGLGVLLIRQSSQVDHSDQWGRPRRDPEAEAARVMGMVGLACVVAGAPIGAVELGGIERRRRDAYVAAAVGEFVGGVLGYLLADRMHGSTSSQLVGLGAGVTLGAASGAAFIPSKKNQTGLFDYRSGTWNVSRPTAHARLPLSQVGSPAVGMTLVSMQF